MKSNHPSTAPPPRHLTPKGQQTRTALLDAARQVFKEMSFYRASVSEISRRCHVSQGTFYQYFKNKEQIFQELNDQILTRFWEKAGALSQEGLGFEGRLSQAVRLLLDHTRENFYFQRILGEFELIDPVAIGYYDSMARYLRGFFRQEAGRGAIRPLSPNLIAYGLIGMAYFHSMDWGPDDEFYPPDQLTDLTVDLIRKGISGPKPWARPPDLAVSSFPDRAEDLLEPEKGLTQGLMTRRAIFQAAEQVFGQYGFHRANISEITRAAGVAQGTFYVHFKSKQDLLKGFIRYLSHEIRWTLKQAAAGTTDRRDAEREGMLAFFRFMGPHRQIYRVVAEGETVGQELGMWYYKRLAQSYTAALRPGIERGEIRDRPVVFMVRSLMGFSHMLGLKWMVWKSFPQAEFPRHLRGEAARFILEGLEPV